MKRTNRTRLKKAIGREGDEISISKNNEITRYIERNTSEGVVPRDHHTQSAVHFIDEEDEQELLTEMRKARFKTETEKFGHEADHIAGSGIIVRADNDSVRDDLT